ncbi:hypothetical protein RJT34_14444 [Clitoria ternatea]|uniref:Uncharacterized protein n=1 Tax=Clitoria ternatea TaxID=43366 RepID=A0AAN9JQR2_CLITE
MDFFPHHQNLFHMDSLPPSSSLLYPFFPNDHATVMLYYDYATTTHSPSLYLYVEVVEFVTMEWDMQCDEKLGKYTDKIDEN